VVGRVKVVENWRCALGLGVVPPSLKARSCPRTPKTDWPRAGAGDLVGHLSRTLFSQASASRDWAIGSAAELLYNTSTNGNHWILIRTVGVKSNRDGIGTRIKLTTESGLVEYNHVTTAGSYASSSDPRVHFGLGTNTLIKEIELRWPSGTVQVLRNVKVDQILKVTEP